MESFEFLHNLVMLGLFCLLGCLLILLKRFIKLRVSLRFVPNVNAFLKLAEFLSFEYLLCSLNSPTCCNSYLAWIIGTAFTYFFKFLVFFFLFSV